MSSIIALVYISLSELQTIDRKYTLEWVNNSEKELPDILYGLGMDITKSVEQQVVEHRNRFGNLITCPRWVGCERVDNEWIESKYSSQEARDKASGSKLILDLYRMRGMTE